MNSLLLVLGWLVTAAFLGGSATPGLETADPTIEESTDVYGVPVTIASGMLVNNWTNAYTNLSLSAEVFDEDGNLVGEGFGYPVNACGAALLPSFELQPGASQPYDIQLELYEADAKVDHVTINVLATPAEAQPEAAEDLPEGVTQAAQGEVVMVEWVDETTIRYGVGCTRDLFTELAWFELDTTSGSSEAITHPHADDITPELRETLGLTDDVIFEISGIQFAPMGRRLVYQDAVHVFFSAEPDGTFIRRVFETLFNRTLQGIYWLPENRLMAYYYGAYGDPVIYFTADQDGRALSADPLYIYESLTLPGPRPDGRSAIIGGAFNDGPTGYYLKNVSNNTAPQLLLETDLPGNNWLPPLFVNRPVEDREAEEVIYLARQLEDGAQIQCLTVDDPTPRDLGSLPLTLSTDERALWWVSPDQRTVAVAATGVNGGLWLVDLDELPGCVE